MTIQHIDLGWNGCRRLRLAVSVAVVVGDVADEVNHDLDDRRSVRRVHGARLPDDLGVHRGANQEALDGPRLSRSVIR